MIRGLLQPDMPGEPASDCALCPRLADFRAVNRTAHPGWHNAPVASFGDPDARLLVVGLAPGLQGANRTARPFTGDYAGDLLYATLAKFGYTSGTYAARPDDGLMLSDVMITNSVRCVPPQNKPTPAEIATCRRFLAARAQAMPRIEVILSLGRIAHESVVRLAGARLKDHPFAHGAHHALPGWSLYDSYHCSRYNTNTGRLTRAMFEAVFADIASALGR